MELSLDGSYCGPTCPICQLVLVLIAAPVIQSIYRYLGPVAVPDLSPPLPEAGDSKQSTRRTGYESEQICHMHD